MNLKNINCLSSSRVLTFEYEWIITRLHTPNIFSHFKSACYDFKRLCLTPMLVIKPCLQTIVSPDKDSCNNSPGAPHFWPVFSVQGFKAVMFKLLFCHETWIIHEMGRSDLQTIAAAGYLILLVTQLCWLIAPCCDHCLTSQSCRTCRAGDCCMRRVCSGQILLQHRHTAGRGQQNEF